MKMGQMLIRAVTLTNMTNVDKGYHFSQYVRLFCSILIARLDLTLPSDLTSTVALK